MITFNAPPFMSEDLPEQGAGIYAFREVFRKANTNSRSLSLPISEPNAWFCRTIAIPAFFPSLH